MFFLKQFRSCRLRQTPEVVDVRGLKFPVSRQSTVESFRQLRLVHKQQAAAGLETNTAYYQAPLASRIFTGRGKHLEKLRTYFGPRNDPSQQRRLFLLLGAGGSGKSQIGLKFAEENSLWRTFWIDATDADTIKLSLYDIAGDPAARASSVKESTESILRWISMTAHEWLLIFDNANGDPDMLAKYMPPGSGGNILITSENADLKRLVSHGASAEVDSMDEDDATSLILKSAVLDEFADDLRRVSCPIATELCCLPLALNQAGAAIANGLCDIHDYLQVYTNNRVKLLDHQTFKCASEYERAVYGTYELLLSTIETKAAQKHNSEEAEVAESAILILQTFAFLHHGNIAEDIFRRAAEAQQEAAHDTNPDAHSLQTIPELPLRLLQLDNDGKWDARSFREGIRVLQSLSLVKRGAACNGYSMHPLVHSWSRDRMLPQEQEMKCRSAGALLSRTITFDIASEDRAFRQTLIPHIRANGHYAVQAGMVTTHNDHVYAGFALVFHENGHWKEAAELEARVVEMRKRVLGIEHPSTLASMTNQASTYLSQGRLKEAEELEVQVMETSMKVLGPEHFNTRVSMGNLTLILSEQRRWKEAEELGVQVMETRKRILGVENPETLMSMDSVASIYRNQGRFKEAAELGVQVVEISSKVLGAEHPNTLANTTNLALTFSDLERWKEAEGLEVQVMETSLKVLGAEHPSTLTSMGNLAGIYQQQERWKEAEELEVRVMKMRSKVLGEEHPVTMISMANLVSMFLKQRRWMEAAELQRRVVETSLKVLGIDHPDTLTRMDTLSSIYLNQGQLKEAEKLQIVVMDKRVNILGTEHPDTVTSMDNLALTYLGQGRWKEAEKLLIQVIMKRTIALGPDDPDTLESVGNLAVTYRNQERGKEAEELEVRVMETTKRVLGVEHPSTLMRMGNLATIYWDQGRLEEAEALEVGVMETMKRVLGTEHPDTLTSMGNLAATYRNQGKRKLAEELEVQVMNTRKRVLGPEHPATLISMANLAHTLKSQGRVEEAIDLMEHAEPLQKRILGSDHPCAIHSTSALSEWRKQR